MGDQGIDHKLTMGFHAPPYGRITDHPRLGSTAADGANGAFDLVSPEPGWTLTIIISDGRIAGELGGWEHVSVHAYRGGKSRIPTWKEMSFVKGLCWDPDDCVMQLHPSQSNYVNTHPHVLHLWRPIDREIPTPPIHLV
jgi:hypothetical protein